MAGLLHGLRFLDASHPSLLIGVKRRTVTVVLDPGSQLRRCRPDTALDLVHHVGIDVKKLLGILPALTEPLLIQVVPGATLAHEPEIGGDIQYTSGRRDPLVVHDVELSLAEGRRDLVLDHLDPRPDADRVLSLLDGLGT